MRDYTDIVEQARKNKKGKTGTLITSSGVKDYSGVVEKARLAKRINLDTLQDDLTSVGSRYESASTNWTDADTMSTLYTDMQNIHGRLLDYQTYMGDNVSQDVLDLIKGYETALGGWDKLTEYYGQFKTPHAYNTAMQNLEFDKQFEGLSYDDVQVLKGEYGQGTPENMYLRKYTNYTNWHDFDKAVRNASGIYKENLETAMREFELDNMFSKYSHLLNTEGFDQKIEYQGSPYNNVIDRVFSAPADAYEYMNRLREAKVSGNYNQLYSRGGLSDPKGVNIAEGELPYDIYSENEVAGLWHMPAGLEEMTLDEINVYFLLANEDEEKGFEYLKDMSKYLSKKRQEKIDTEQKTNLESGGDVWRKAKQAGASIMSVPENVFGSAYAFVNDIGEMVAGYGVNPYDENHMARNRAEVTRETVGENIQEYTEDHNWIGTDVPIIGNAWSFGYDTGMSVLDSATGIALLGPSYQYVAATSAFESRAKELTEAGASNAQILVGASLAGGFEWFFEKHSIENLLKNGYIDDPLKWVKATFGSQGFTELSEEACTEIANIVSDICIRGTQSDAYKMYEDYISRGYSEKEAITKVSLDLSKQVAKAGVGGYFSGVAMGGVSNAHQYNVLKNEGEYIRQNKSVSDLKDLVIDANQDSYQKYIDLIDNDKISDAKLGSLYGQVREDVVNTYDKASTDAQMKPIVDRLGESKGAIETASAIVKKMNGEKLTSSEKALLKTENAQMVVDEISRGEIKVGSTSYFDKAYTDMKKVESLTREKTADEKAIQERVEELNKGTVTEVTATGNSTKIESIKKDGDSTIVVTSEGEFKAEDMTFSKKDAHLVSYAEVMDQDKANLFLQQYDGKSDVEDYKISFDTAYKYGELGFNADTVLKHKGVLTEAQASAIYTQAVKLNAERKQKAIDAINEKYSGRAFVEGSFDDSIIDYKGTSKDPNKVKWSELTTKQRRAISFAKAFAKVTGVNIRFIKSKVLDGEHKGENGRYIASKNTIEIDVFAGRIDAKSTYDAIISTLSHEVTHWMKEKSPAIYSKMREHIAETLAMEGTSIDKRIDDERQDLVEKHPEFAKLSNEELTEMAIDELVARSCEDMLTNSKKARELLSQLTPKQQKSLIGKLQEVVQNIIDWADELLNEYKSDSEEAKILREHKDRLQELSKMWDEALTEAIKTNQSVQAGGVSVDNGAHTLFSSSRYDYSKPFAEQVEDYKNKLIPQGDTLLIGATPDVYKMIGLNALPMTLNTTHVDYALNGTKDFDHYLGESLLKQLPEAIKQPVAIMTSLTDPKKSIVALLEIRHNGKQVVVPVSIDGFGVQNGVVIDSNAITSLYGKKYSISKVLKDAIQQESRGQFRLFYLNKNKATALLQVSKVPMPKLPATRNDGFIHSVRDINSPVKPKFNDVTETQQFIRWFGNWRKSPNNINKALLNQDGTPKKFYHYTSAENGEFYIFDETKAVKKGGLGFKALGKGNYFTEKKLPSNNRYGSREIEAYVSIKNPFVYPGGEAFLDYARRELGLSKEANYDDVQQEMRKRGYDGVIGDGMGIVVAFDSSQIKSTDNIGTFDASNPDIRYSDRNYTYEALVSKSNMSVTKVQSTALNRSEVTAKAIENVKDNGYTNENGNAVIYVDDIKRNIIVPNHSITHGMDRRFKTQAPVLLHIGEVLKNAIRINELNPRSEDIAETYALIGVASDNNVFYTVSFVVNSYTNEVDKIDVLYSSNTKKGSAALLPTFTKKFSATPTDPDISIANLLELVNLHFADLLPEDVLRKFGYDRRPEGKLGASALYSDRNNTSVHERLGQGEDLKKQNAKLEADIARLKERLKLERQVTKGNTFNAKQLGAVAGHLRNISNSTYDKATLVEELKDIYTYIVETPNLEWEELMVQCQALATKMLDNSKGEKVTNDYFKDVLADIRKARIKLNEGQIQEAKNAYGEKYRDAFMGRIMLAKDGVSLDQQWKEWSSMYPEIFDESISDADQITALSDIYDALREGAESYQKYNDIESVRELAVEVYNQYWNVSTITTTADKYDKQIKRLNFEHRKAMGELRSDFKEKMKNQETADAIYYGRIINDIRKKKDAEVKAAKEKGTQKLSSYKEAIEKKAKIQSITDKAMVLNKWIKNNSKDKPVPEAMKQPVAHLLSAIDFSSKQLLGIGRMTDAAFTPTRRDQNLALALSEVYMMAQEMEQYDDIRNKENADKVWGNYVHLPERYVWEIKQLSTVTTDIMEKTGDTRFVLNQMSNEELDSLGEILNVLKTAINTANECLSFYKKQTITGLADEHIDYAEQMEKKQGGNAITEFFEFDQSQPVFFFDRLGPVGKKFFAVFQDAMDKLALKSSQIREFTSNLYGSKEANEWSKQVLEFEVIDVKRASTKMIRMTATQAMSLYLLSKRAEAHEHLYGGGIRMADFEVKGKKVTDSEGAVIKPEFVEEVTKRLSNRQIEVADKLSEFLNTYCTDWGNETTMLLYGTKMFGKEKHYYPMEVVASTVKVTARDNPESLYSILNMSFTKKLVPNASNQVVLRDIFEVFASHTSSMARYNTFAAPVYDFLKWYGYNEKVDTDNGQYDRNIQDSIESMFGKAGNKYIREFLKDINGNQQAGRGEEVIGKLFSNFKLASVAWNLNVALLQPISYLRAAAILSPKYLMKGIGIRKIIDGNKKAKEHSGIAIWKSMGYYDTDISKGLEEQIKNSDKWYDTLKEASMKLPEWADQITWGALWKACEYYVADNNKALAVGSDEFINAVNTKFRDIVYRTQVVDSVMTRSQLMRSKSGVVKGFTSFMSESTVTYNMVSSIFYEWQMDKRSPAERRKKYGKRLASAIAVYALSAVAESSIRALTSAMRNAGADDDDDEKVIDEFLAQLIDNLNPLSKVPILREVVSVSQGYSFTALPGLQAIESTKKAYDAIVDMVIDGEEISYKKVYKILQAVSQWTGQGASNAFREVVAIWNTVFGAVYPQWQVKIK